LADPAYLDDCSVDRPYIICINEVRNNASQICIRPTNKSP